jgi:hypothetical protein
MLGRGILDCCAQAPLDPVPLRCMAYLLRDRQAKAEPQPVCAANAALHRHALGMKAAARGRRKEVRSFRQPPEFRGAWSAHGLETKL